VVKATRHTHGHSAGHTRTWWIGVLFSIGSVCFLVGPFPGFVELVGSHTDGMVFFVGSIFFTTAAALQLLDGVVTHEDRLDLWASIIQLGGTLYFNISTWRALDTAMDDPTAYDKLVWAPDAIGSVLFLASGLLAYAATCGGVFRRWPRTRPGAIAAWNLLGCVAFGISAIGAYLVPDTGDVVDLAAANVGTSFGALCFLIGALLLLPRQQQQVAA
jgi:hypothetical protein